MPPWRVLLPEFLHEQRRKRRVVRAVRSGTPILHLTHAQCLDGASCSLVHWIRYGRGQVHDLAIPPFRVAETIGWIAEAAREPRTLHISDLSVGTDDDAGAAAKLRTLRDDGWEIAWRDHHAGQWTEATRGLVEAAVDELVLDTDGKLCGTDLVQRDLLPDDPFAKRLAEVVRDRDLWLKEIPYSDTLACAMNELGPKHLMDVLYETRNLHDPRIEEAAEEWNERLDRERREAKSKTKVLEGQNGHTVGILYGDYTTSDIAAAMREEHDTDVEAILKPHGGVSLRSRDGIDVSEVARRFDGGGHAQAAGCSLELTAPEYLWYWVTKGGGLKPRRLVDALKAL